MRIIKTRFAAHRRILFIVGIALAMRGLLFLVFMNAVGVSVFWEGADDVRAYVALAKNMLTHGSFISQNEITPESWYTPGYPAFLAGFWYAAHSWIPAIVVQHVLAAGSAVLVYVIGKSFFTEKIGFTAALVFALEPTSLYLSSFLWSETLFLFLFLLFLYFFLQFLFSPEWPNVQTYAVLAGVFLAAATYVRQIAFLIPLALIFFMAMIGFIAPPYATRRRMYGFVLFLVMSMGLVTPWMARNKILFDSWSLGASSSVTLYFIDAVSFAYYRNAHSKIGYIIGAEHVEKPEGDVWPRSQGGIFSDDAGFGLHLEDFYTKKAKDIILAHPVEYVSFHLVTGVGGFMIQDTWRGILRRAGFTLSRSGLKEALFNRNIPIVRSLVSSGNLLWFLVGFSGHVFFIAVTILMIMGTVTVFRRGPPITALTGALLLFLFFYFAVATGPVAYRDRYRYPALPAMFLLAATGLFYKRDMLHAKSHDLGYGVDEPEHDSKYKRIQAKE